jgi:hypothetical protein
MSDYNSGATTGETVGFIIAKMAQHFGMQNLEVVHAQNIYSRKVAETEAKVDDNGKAISSAKAQSLVAATTEAELYRETLAHLANIEAYINALKSLQKGILNEFAHMGVS